MTGVVSPPARLQAFLAALTELAESERAPLLRAYLEYTLEVVQASEERYYKFLGECATLAADNMQDIRIEHLEQRVDAIESPSAKPWGEVVTDVALAFAMQLGILLGWELVAGGVIALAGGRAVVRATRMAQLEISAARTESAMLKAEYARLWNTRSDLHNLSAGGWTAKPTRGGWRVTPLAQTWRFGATGPIDVPSSLIYSQSAEISLKNINNEIDSISLQLKLIDTATGTNHKRMESALKTYQEALVDGTKASQKIKADWGQVWRDNVGNEKGGILLGMTEEIVTAFSELGNTSNSAAPTASALAEPFLSSEITGRYLDWIGQAQLDAIESYAGMRLMLRATTDDALIEGDEFLKMVALLGTEVLPRWQDLIARSSVARPAIVKGMEAAFWREYLSANGILAAPVQVNKILPKMHAAGEIADGYLILSTGKQYVYTDGELQAMREMVEGFSIPEPFEMPPPSYEHQALLYPGMGRIPQLLAVTLFRRFAQPYYENSAKVASLTPFAYRSEAYAGLKIPPEENAWGYPNPDSLRKLGEIRFMVIRFFMEMTGNGIDPTLASMVDTLSFMNTVAGADADRNRDEWLSAQMQCVDESGQQTADAETLQTRAVELHFRRIAENAGIVSSTQQALQIEQLQFADALMDLNQDIQAYQLMKSGALELGATGDTRTLEDLKIEITAEQGAVGEWYEKLLKNENADEDLRAALIERYESAVFAVRQWEPGQDWVWYGSSESLPEQPPGESEP
ncbi:MAG: hypothetical protein E6Q88_00435 [Lysobacteraceae bacterium]|nr:MAG: hypothetical protein E6Q88_00435 [Xanthomonadaceae bacterium]